MKNQEFKYEKAWEWYSDYVWSLQSETGELVELQSLDSDYLDGETSDDDLSQMLPDFLTEDEKITIIVKAHEVWADANWIEANLFQAVEHFNRNDKVGAHLHLDAAKNIENQHGDCSASRELRKQMFPK